MAHSRPRRPLGRCSFLFFLALGSDFLGLTLILLGIFLPLELRGQSFGDLLIYSGGILLFFSLLWWLAWYSLNLEVSLDELLRWAPESPKESGLEQLARKVSERFSKRSRRKAKGAPSPLTLANGSSPRTTRMTSLANGSSPRTTCITSLANGSSLRTTCMTSLANGSSPRTTRIPILANAPSPLATCIPNLASRPLPLTISVFINSSFSSHLDSPERSVDGVVAGGGRGVDRLV